MNSLQRILLASRAAIREMAVWHYALSSGIVCVILFFVSIVNQDKDAAGGVLFNQYAILDANVLIGIIVFAGWLSATIICGSAFFKDFKEEDRGVRYFSLPVTNKERFASLLLVNWGFVSLISFGPPIIIAGCGWLLAPDYMLLPPPQYLLAAMLLGPLAHLLSSCYWMFSAIAYPKLGAVFIFGFVGLLVLYLLQTRGWYPEQIVIEHTTSAFNTMDVVGMMDYNFLREEATPEIIKYNALPGWNRPALLLSGLCFAFMLASAAMALKRKTA